MKTKKLRVDFQKLINNQYYLEDKLLIYQWLIQLGQTCNKQYGWNRYGLHQAFHGYSKNNEPKEVYALGKNYYEIIDKGFVNLLCKTNKPLLVKEFLEPNRIQLGKIRVLNIPEYDDHIDYFRNISNHYGLEDLLSHITVAYKGLLLKKNFFHSDYADRINPRIIDNMSFGTNYGKWYAWFEFSFDIFDYEPGWRYDFSQKDGESIYGFFDRVIKEMDDLIVYSDDCNNCPLWIENAYSGAVLRHGYRGFCKSYHGCTRPDVQRYSWSHDKPGPITDNALHYSIVFPYIKERK